MSRISGLDLVVVDNPGTGPHPTIQAAINDAKSPQNAPVAAVWIPASYNGSDSLPTTPGVALMDMRGSAGSFTGASSSGLPTGVINPTSPSTLCPGCNAKADLIGVTDATITNGSNVVTTGGSDPAFTSADNGKACWATSGGGTGVQRISGKLSMAQGTLAVTGAHTATCATANANATGTNNNTFFWATDDTAAMTAAWTAANPANGPCHQILLPGAAMLVNSHFGSAGATTCGFNLGGVKEGIGVTGNGFASILVIGPNFDFTTCNGGSGNVCFFAGNGLFLNSFVIYGGERCDCPAAANNKILVGIGGDSVYDVVQLVGWCASNANASTTGFAPASSNGNSTNYINVDGFGSTCFSTSNYPVRVSGSTFLDCSVAALVVGGGVFTSTDNFFGDSGGVNGSIQVSGGVWQSTGDNCIQFSGGTENGIRITGGTANITDMQCYQTSNTASSALWVSGGTANVSLSMFKGGGGTGVDLFLDTGKFNNLGGNSFLNNKVLVTANATNNYSGEGAFTGSVTGTLNAASTIGFYGLGQFTTTAGTNTTVNLGQVMQNSGTIYGVIARAGTGGTNASSGVVTVIKTNSAGTVLQAATCTLGTGTFCQFSNSTLVTFVQGDVISAQVTTQAADTLANVRVTVIGNYA